MNSKLCPFSSQQNSVLWCEHLLLHKLLSLSSNVGNWKLDEHYCEKDQSPMILPVQLGLCDSAQRSEARGPTPPTLLHRLNLVEEAQLSKWPLYSWLTEAAKGRTLLLLLLKQGLWPLASCFTISPLICQRNVWLAHSLCGLFTVTQRFWDTTGRYLWACRPGEERCWLGCVGCVRPLAYPMGKERRCGTDGVLYP